MKQFILGITGGIGSGKSTVSRLLASYCLAPVIDLDQCCRDLLTVDRPGWLALRQHLGSMFFLDSGEVDRKVLRERIFADADFRRQVEGVLHPLVRTIMRAELGRHHSELILIEIPLLYEVGWQGEVNGVLVVYARPGVQCCRIMRRDGASRRNATLAIASQQKLSEKAKRADYVIDNSGSWVATRDQVIGLAHQLCG